MLTARRQVLDLLLVFVLALVLVHTTAAGRVLDFEELGAIRLLDDSATEWHNGALLNSTLNSLHEGDVFIIPNTTFSLMGGVLVSESLTKVVFQLDGTLSFSQNTEAWPRSSSNGRVLECVSFNNLEDVVFTSSGGHDNRGTLQGNGKVWWGAIQYLLHQEDRPRLFHIAKSKNIVFEKIRLINSPYWTFWAQNCNGLVVRYSEIDVRWDQADKHTYLDLQAFNTDGFDVTGQYVHMHDVTVWNDDDCICVKDNSQHMLFERITASGLGLVVGSIGSSVVHNITFKDAVMHNTVKGIYMKTRWSDEAPPGENVVGITDILYQNITMYEPSQFAVWIGPAQQSEAGSHCSLIWPHFDARCEITGYHTWRNIVLRDIFVYGAKQSPGVIMGNASNPMTGVKLENVVFSNFGQRVKPWGQDYFCSIRGVKGESFASEPNPGCLSVIQNAE